jgi:cytochrome b6-f complex iron-sulfur subunit
MTTRREFLVVLGATTACGAVAVLPGCGDPPGPVAAGNVSDLEVGDVKAVDGSGVIVARDAAGVYAMTAICTHLGCDMSDNGGGHQVADTGIRCGCHGSRFDLQGNVTGGPATQPLKHWQVDIADDGAITVQVGEEVAADARAAV